MYASNYGYAQGGPPPGYNLPPNSVPSPAPHGSQLHGPPQSQQQQAQHPQQQQQHHQQQQQQQQQHMMFNPSSQYGPGSAHQPGYGGAPQGPNLNANMVMAGQMMQNGGMAHMAGNNGIAPYQTPYTSSPYGAGMPSASPAHAQQPFMQPSSNGPQFGMQAQSMTPQPHQRMQPPPISTPVSSAQRALPYGGPQHSTPPQNQAQAQAQAQAQFMSQTNNGGNPNQQQMSQNMSTSQNQNAAPQSAGVQTPKTPSFPAGAGNPNLSAPPLSPGSEIREKGRVTLLLEINRELLMEVMRIQGIQADAKKESNPPDSAATAKERAEKAASLAVVAKEFVECMRRLQSNLAYLAAIADRSHKPSSQIPSHPAILTAPILSDLSKVLPKQEIKKSPTSSAQDQVKLGAGTEENKADRAGSLKDLYRQLQGLFPSADLKKEAGATAVKGKPMQQGNMAAGGNAMAPSPAQVSNPNKPALNKSNMNPQQVQMAQQHLMATQHRQQQQQQQQHQQQQQPQHGGNNNNNNNGNLNIQNPNLNHPHNSNQVGNMSMNPAMISMNNMGNMNGMNSMGNMGNMSNMGNMGNMNNMGNMGGMPNMATMNPGMMNMQGMNMNYMNMGSMGVSTGSSGGPNLGHNGHGPAAGPTQGQMQGHPGGHIQMQGPGQGQGQAGSVR